MWCALLGVMVVVIWGDFWEVVVCASAGRAPDGCGWWFVFMVRFLCAPLTCAGDLGWLGFFRDDRCVGWEVVGDDDEAA